MEVSRIQHRNNRVNKEGIRSVLFLLPTWLMLLIFFIGPILMTFYFAFTNFALTGSAARQMEFVGFKNFVFMFKDPSFQKSVSNTIIFLIFSAVLGQQILGFLIAFLMKAKNRTFRRVVGMSVLAGWVTPEIVCAFAWSAFLHDEGTLNGMLNVIGIEPISWLFTFPMVSIIIANIWRGTAFSMMIFQSALDDIPRSVEEASMIDGANVLQRLGKIIIPMLKETIVTNMVLVTLQTLGVFGMIYALTGGGPGMKTQTLPIFMYNQAFVKYQLGYGTAISLIMLLIGAVASIIYIKLLKVDI